MLKTHLQRRQTAVTPNYSQKFKKHPFNNINQINNLNDIIYKY